MKRLKKQLKANNQISKYQLLIDRVWAKDWVVYCEPSFADADRVIKYLGQYTHRVAISNQRIQNIDKSSVSFFYKDYTDSGKLKLTSLTGIEFLRRFSMHILPKGFVKVRYYVILSNRYSRQTTMFRKPQIIIKGETTQLRIFRLTGFDVHRCPFCKKGKMHTIEIIPKIRSPVKFLYAKPENIYT